MSLRLWGLGLGFRVSGVAASYGYPRPRKLKGFVIQDSGELGVVRVRPENPKY